MTEEAERAFIRKAVLSIERTTGRRPYGWLSRYLLTPNTRRLMMDVAGARAGGLAPVRHRHLRLAVR